MSVTPKREPVRLHAFINHPVTDVAVIVLILVSVLLLVVEELMEDGHAALVWVQGAGDMVTILFALELSIRYRVARKKARFFRRYWPDLLALLPILRPVRFFRLLRLLRLLRLFQLGLLLDRRVAMLRGVFRVNFYILWVLLVLTAILVVCGGIMVFLFEHDGPPQFGELQDGLWWAAYTIIAGEPIGGMPSSILGRLLLVGLMLGGMTIFAVVTGVISATMIERLRGVTRLGEMDIEELEGHSVICGWNAGVEPLLTELGLDENLRGIPVVLVNTKAQPYEVSHTGLRRDLLYYVNGDPTQIAVLEKAGIKRASRVVVMADDQHDGDAAARDARSVLAALTIEKMNPDIYSVVELMNAENQPHLEVAGVEAVIMRSDLSGRALASACRNPALMDVMMNLLTLQRGETVHRLPGPKEPTPFADLLARLKTDRDVLAIGVDTRGGRRQINPSPSFSVGPEDWVIVIGARNMRV